MNEWPLTIPWASKRLRGQLIRNNSRCPFQFPIPRKTDSAKLEHVIENKIRDENIFTSSANPSVNDERKSVSFGTT
jgi:hypothetical protein